MVTTHAAVTERLRRARSPGQSFGGRQAMDCLTPPAGEAGGGSLRPAYARKSSPARAAASAISAAEAGYGSAASRSTA